MKTSRPVSLSVAFRALLLTAFACLVGSCASVNATTDQYVGAPKYPASDPAEVQIVREEPKQPHDKLGEIVVDASTDPAPPISDIENKLRTEAAKMGADAVVVVLDRVQPTGLTASGGYWNRSVSTVTGRKLIGIAIKYR